MRVIHWNISWAGNIELKVEFLKKNIVDNTIICLQEVQQPQYEYLVKELKPINYSYSLDIRPPGKNEGRNRKLGVCILSNFGKVSETGVISISLFPDRTLYNQIDDIKILSFHSITGCDYKKSKSTNFASIADYLEENELDFFTTDMNEPDLDYLDESQVEFHKNGYNAYLILGAEKVHKLNDCLRDFKKGTKKNKSPLEISYKTRAENKRYDFIYYNPKKWKVLNVKYEYKKAVEVGGDHALILADFELVV